MFNLNQNRWAVLAVVVLGSFMAALDSSIVNVSIPPMMHSFSCSVESIEWVVTSYMLGMAIFMPLTSWIRNHLGQKNLYLLALAIFTIGSLLCGLSWNLPVLIVSRLIQSFGAGAITPTSMAIISDYFEKDERGKALGYWGVGVVIGPTIGPTLGGYLTELYGWRSIFLINLPVGIIGIMLAVMAIKKDEKTDIRIRPPFDFPGFAYFTISLASFLLAISMAERLGFSSSPIIGALILSLVTFVAFIRTELRTHTPLIDIHLFRLPVFVTCLFITAVRSIGLFGSVFLLPVFFQSILGKTETQTGLLLLPSSLVVALTMPIAGNLNDKYGPRVLAMLGLVFLSAFMFLYSHLNSQMSDWELIWPTLLRGVGLGLLIAPVSASTINSVPKEKIAMASSISSIIQQTASSIGIAVLASIYAHKIQSTRFMALDEPLNKIRALETSFIVAGIVMLIALVPAMRLPKGSHRRGSGQEPKNQIISE